jgi:hypothetical protein
MYIASASTKVYVFLDILESADLVCSMHVLFFFLITQYIGDTYNAHTLIPMNTRTQTLPLGASSKTVPANPQD